MPPRISVIIPTYNGHKYLGACLDATLTQTLPHDAYEVIVVDDKSSDGTLDLARAYEREYAPVRVVALPERTPGGPGFGSNMGIKMARGEYVILLDHDDLPGSEMFATLLATAEAERADIAFCSFAMLYPDGNRAGPYDTNSWRDLFVPGFETLPLTAQKNAYLATCPAPWRKIHRRGYLLENAVTFPVSEYFFEDIVFHWRAVLAARKLARINTRLITYRVGRADQITAKTHAKAALDQTVHLWTIKMFLQQQGIYDEYKQTFLLTVADALSRVPEDDPAFPTVKAAVVAVCEDT
ncbi:MAG: hypothetical protein DELT_02800 [Desulfovibrio sp.]